MREHAHRMAMRWLAVCALMVVLDAACVLTGHYAPGAVFSFMALLAAVAGWRWEPWR